MPNIVEEIEGFMDNFREYKNFEYKFQQVFCLIRGVENAIHVEVALLLIIFFLSFLFFFGVLGVESDCSSTQQTKNMVNSL